MLENKIEMWVIMFLLDRLLINFRLEERTLCLEIGTRTIVISTISTLKWKREMLDGWIWEDGDIKNYITE